MMRNDEKWWEMMRNDEFRRRSTYRWFALRRLTGQFSAKESWFSYWRIVIFLLRNVDFIIKHTASRSRRTRAYPGEYVYITKSHNLHQTLGLNCVCFSPEQVRTVRLVQPTSLHPHSPKLGCAGVAPLQVSLTFPDLSSAGMFYWSACVAPPKDVHDALGRHRRDGAILHLKRWTLHLKRWTLHQNDGFYT